ncbi:MAG: sensor histidine kinase [Ferruginibacter sp.]
MIRDQIMRLLFIPLLGIGIAYLSHIITYENYTTIELTGAYLYFVFTSYCIWAGCQWIHIKLRNLYTVNQKPFSKLLSISVISGLYGSAVACILCLLWMRFSRETFNWVSVNKFILASVLAVIVFTLVYEILYLSKEREIDNKIVDQLDQELNQAEMIALRNELDPHFIFNSLNTLSQLIVHDSKKAVMFNKELAEVYKYFLINKNKELVTVENEIEFIKSYFFLLRIRHDNKLHLFIEMEKEDVSKIFIIPCALQILVENAIKHNQFTNEHPLYIYLFIQNNFLALQNSIMPRASPAESTGVGLRNLNAQYLITAKQHIISEKTESLFTVKLPVIKYKNIKP